MSRISDRSAACADLDLFAASTGFNAFGSAISNAFVLKVPPNNMAFLPISVDPAEFVLTPMKGLTVVTPDDKSGAAAADLIQVTVD